MTAPAPVCLRVPLAAFVLGATQCREETDEELVKEYAAARRGGAELPAPDVFARLIEGALPEGAKVWIGDGEHRVRSAMYNGVAQDIECYVHEGGEEEAFRFALRANRNHGKRMTNADKRHAVRRALERWPNLSDRQIAKLADVGYTLVADVRKKLEEEQGTARDGQLRTGADGKARRLPGTAPEQPEEDPRQVGLFPVGLGGAAPLPPPPAEPPPTYAPVLPGPAGEALAGLPLQPERKASPAAQTLVQDEPAPASDEVEKQATPEEEGEDDTDDDAPATTRAAAAKPGDPYEVGERIALLRSSAALRAVPEAERPAVAAALVDLARELDPQGSPQIPDWIVRDRDQLSDDVNAARARVRELEAQIDLADKVGAEEAARRGFEQGERETLERAGRWLGIEELPEDNEDAAIKLEERCDLLHNAEEGVVRYNTLAEIARSLGLDVKDDADGVPSHTLGELEDWLEKRVPALLLAETAAKEYPEDKAALLRRVGAAEEEAAKARELLALAPALADPEEALRLREDAQDVRAMRVRLRDLERKLTDAELEVERLRGGDAGDPVLAVACPQCQALPGKPCDTCGLRKVAARKAAEQRAQEQPPAEQEEDGAEPPAQAEEQAAEPPAQEQRHRCYAPGCGRFDTTREYLPGVGAEEYVCPGHGGKKPVDARVVDARVRRAEVVFETEKFTVIVWGTEYVRRDDAQAALDAAAEKAGPLVVNRTTVRSQEAEGADCYTGSLILAAMPERFDAMRRAEAAARAALSAEGYALGPDMAHRSPCTRCGAEAGQPCTNYKKQRKPTCKERGLVKLDEDDAPQGELTLERDEPTPAPKKRRGKAVRS